MSQKNHVNVYVEYCGVCDYEGHCLRLADKLRKVSEDVEVLCKQGRRGAFEVLVNDVPVYSKLQTMALPDYEAVASTVKAVTEGEPVTPVRTSQPIDCVIS